MKRTWIIPMMIKMLILAPTLGSAQWSQHDQDQWLFGLNAGLMYQGSDIPDLHTGWGGGITLGKTLYQQSGTPLAFDLRGRILMGTTYGQDHIPYQDTENNDALNGERQTPASVDYSESSLVFVNNKTQIGELGMEGVVRFNQLREKSNVHLAMFGGIGLDWYKTKMDQLDGQQLYDYANWTINNKNRNTVLADLQKHQDGHYETMADGFHSNFGRIGLMPSLGIELGYHFTPGFALIGGHRVSFAGTDVLDGVQYTGKNDKYHYTSLGFQWTIKKDKEKTLPPKIRITFPESNPVYLDYPDATLLATLERVDKSRDIQLYLNGRQVKYFHYEKGRLQANIILRHGRNDVLIVASNDAGTERAKQTLIYEESVIGFEPEIKFIFPIQERPETSQRTIDIRLQSRHVVNRDGINIWVNGRVEKDFRFDPETGLIDLNMVLSPGTNKLQVTAVNDHGKASSWREIIHLKEARPVTINWQNPSTPYSETSDSKAELIAIIYGIDYREQLQFMVNNRVNGHFSFDPSTGRFNATLPLATGDNVVTLRASNEVSGDQVERTIFRREIVKPEPFPIVTIDRIKQIGNIYKLEVNARVHHVDHAGQVQFEINGRQAAFDFDPLTGQFTARIAAIVGKNKVLIRGWNNRGEAQDVGYFNLTEKAIPPIVSFLQPVERKVTIPGLDYRVMAKVENIDARDQVSISVNGNFVSHYSLNTGTGKLEFSPTLAKGENQVVIKASNSAGYDEVMRTIFVTKEEFVAPASLSITFPAERFFMTTKSNIIVLAQTTRINSARELKISLNGQTISDFAFDRRTGKVSISVNLKAGNNRFLIASPMHDLRDERIIQFEKPQAAPTVRIVKPSKDTEVGISDIYVTALLTGIERKDQILITHENVPIKDYDFSGKKDLKIPLTLKPGSNDIVIRVSNKGGQAHDTRKVVYRPPASQLENTKPAIRYLAVSQPTVSPFDPDNARSRVTATLINTSQKGDILLIINGKRKESFDFVKGQLSAIFDVREGRNTIRLTVSNRIGTDTEIRTINFSGPDKKPRKKQSDKESGPKRHS